MVAPPAVLAGEVAVRMTLLAVAGAAFPADLAEVVAVDVTSLADAGMGTDLWSFVDAGPKGPSPVSRATSDPLVSIGVVDSEPELGDKLRLPDFFSDNDPGNPSRDPGVYWHGRSL